MRKTAMASDCGSYLVLLLMVPLLIVKTETSRSCRDPPPDYPTLLKKSSRLRSVYFSGERVFYNCALGYTNAAGSLFVRCENGLWTQLNHRCEREHSAISCPSLSVANGVMISGVMNSTSYRPTDSVRFACRDGFDLNGPKEIACGPDGQWDPQPPQCLPSGDRESCGPPASYPNMHPVGVDLAQQLFPPKSRVAYECAMGYTRTQGTRRISECTDGHWTRIYMKCQRKVCGSAGEILHGHYNYQGVQFGDRATAVCNQGFELIGRPYRHCLEMGWDGRDPVCEAVQCDEPPSVVDAEWSGPRDGMFPYRTVVTYQCLKGQLIGKSEIHCTHDGKWSSEAPMCRDITCSSPAVPNGEKTSGLRLIYKYGDSVSFRCSKGYVLSGNSSVTCSANGEWTPALPKCTRKVCGSAGEILHGHYNYQGVQFGDRATAVCNQGYKLIGHPYRHCLEMGWDGRDPVCEAVQCDEPPSVVDAEWSGPRDGMFPYRTVVTYQCLKGQLIGKSEIHCTRKGKWSSKAPVCRDMTCSSPAVANGERTSGLRLIYKYGDSVSFRCSKGYVLSGNSSVTCSAKGQWKPALPKCTLIKCPEIKVENGAPSSKRTAPGQTVTIKCNTDFLLQGAHKVTCLLGGSWNAILPKCILEPGH